jgi:threonine/homoserine/homoserine lactone efflux protein
MQCLVLGAILAALDIVYETGLVWLSSSVARALNRPRARRWRNRWTGAVLVGLGVRLALVERR